MSAGRNANARRWVEALLETKELADLPDGQVLERFVHDRDEAAFAALVQRHGPMVLGVCHNILRNAHDAEDAFQATFLVLAVKANQIRRQNSVASWLFGTAHRVAHKSRARTSRQQVLERTRAEIQTDLSRQIEEQQSRSDWLYEELSRLPDRDRQVLVLCYLEGRTQEQAARSLGCPAGSISRHLRRACELLRERLVRQGVTRSVPALLAVMAGLSQAAVPVRLSQATLQAATGTVGNGMLASATTGSGVVLAREVLQAMTGSKLKALASVFLLVGAITAGTALIAQPGGKEKGHRQEPRAGQPDSLEAFRKRSPADRLRALNKLPQAEQLFQKTAPGVVLQIVTERGALDSAVVSDVVSRVKGPARDGYASIIKWLIDEGTRVNKGDKVLELDDSAWQEQLKQQTARLERAEADQTQAADNLALIKVQNLAEIRIGEIAVRLAKLEAKKQMELIRNPLALSEQKEIAELKLEQARLMLERTRAQCKARAGKAEAKLRVKKTSAEQEKSRQRAIEEEIKKCLLTAPQDGLVVYYVPEGHRNTQAPIVALGEPVREGQKLLRICDLKHFLVNARVPEAQISRIRKKQQAVVRVDALPDRKLAAEVTAVSTAASSADWLKSGVKVFAVQLTLKEALPRLKPGMSAEVNILTDEKQEVLRVPVQAVLTAGKDHFCYVRIADGIYERKVVLGLQGEQFVEIKEGLKEGDLVLSDPQTVSGRLEP